MPRIRRLVVILPPLVLALSAVSAMRGVAPSATSAAGDPTRCSRCAAPRDDIANIRLVGGLPTDTWLDMALDDEPIFKDLEYKDVGDYAATGAGIRVLRITPKDSSDPVIEGEIALEANTDYTVAMAGTEEAVEAFLVADDNTAPEPGEARIKLLHLAQGAPSLDVVAGDVALWENVAYGEASAYIRLDAGTYAVDVREAGTNNPLLPADDLTVEAGTVYTLLALGRVDGEPPFMLLLSADAADLPTGNFGVALPALYAR